MFLLLKEIENEKAGSETGFYFVRIKDLNPNKLSRVSYFRYIIHNDNYIVV